MALDADPRRSLEGMAGLSHAADGRADIELRPRYVATDAPNVGRQVSLMQGVLGVADMAASAEGVAVGLHVCFLAVDFVAGHARDACLAVIAGAPLGYRASMAGAT